MKKFNAFLIVICLSLSTFNTFAQTPAYSKIKFQENSKIPAFFSFQQNDQIDYTLFENWMKENFKMDENLSFKVRAVDVDLLGYKHYRLVQTYKGIEIFAAELVVHSKDGNIVSFNGMAFDKLKSVSSNEMTENQALEQALKYVDAETYMWENEAEENHLKSFTENPDATYFPIGQMVYINANKNFKNSELRLAYKFNIYALNPLSRAEYFVDAENGEILFVNQIIHDVNVPGTAETKFSGQRTIKVDSISIDSFILRDASRGKGVETYNMKNGTSYSNASDFVDKDNYWNNINAQKDEIATDAHWATEMTYDFYLNKFGRNSIDGNGFKLASYLHYSTNYANAFWNGAWMTYGDGNVNQEPFVSIDICGHEITHGLTERTANLIYSHQSGALNEAFSDIFGNMVEFYGKPSNFSWDMGEDVGTPLRSMSNPNSKGDPDCIKGNYWINTENCTSSQFNDNCGVHTNSSVLNYWFYLLSEGGNGTNDLGSKYDVKSIGKDKSSAIAFRTLVYYLIPTSDYLDARYYSIQSAVDLYGECSNEVKQVTNAWYAVGVKDTTNTADFITSKTTWCTPPFSVKFNNRSEYYTTHTWDFGDGTFSNENNPSHIYNSYGTFTVKLIVSSSCGADTAIKTNLITIDSNSRCDYTMPSTNSHDTINLCTGSLFDNGGPDGNYTGDLDAMVTIAPPGATNIILKFNSFAFEGDCDCDWLYIYDGPDATSPLIGKYSGFNLPNGGIIESKTGTVSIRQYTDPARTYSGFDLDWYCVQPGDGPFVDFASNKTYSCDGQTEFKSLVLNNPTNWLWDFGDGFSSSDTNPIHQYAQPGTYSVKLVASNQNKTDSVLKSDFIYYSIPKTPKIDDIENCGPGSFEVTGNHDGILVWYDENDSLTPAYIGDKFKTEIISSTSKYFVEEVTNPLFTGVDNKDVAAGGYYNQNRYHALIFDAYSEFKLISVKVYADGAGDRTIVLKDNTGTIIQQKIISMEDGEQVVYLNFDIPEGTDLELGCQPIANLFRNSGGISFPIKLSSILSITKTTATATGYDGYYYYFYDWLVQESSCIGEKEEFTITIVDDKPIPDFDYNIVGNKVIFTNKSTNGSNYSWDFGDGLGSSNDENPEYTFTGSGSFKVTLQCTNLCGDSSVSKTINITSSLDENLNAPTIEIYPNPATNFVNCNVKISQNLKYQLKIYDLLGNLVYDNIIFAASGKNNVLIDTKSFAKGVYNIQFVFENEIINKKVTIQ